MCTRELWNWADLRICILLLTLRGSVTLGHSLFHWLTEFMHTWVPSPCLSVAQVAFGRTRCEAAEEKQAHVHCRALGVEDHEAFPPGPLLASYPHAPKMLACSLFNFKWGKF